MGDTEEDLVRFFASLAPDARAEYEELAEHDRRFGEDVDMESRS